MIEHLRTSMKEIITDLDWMEDSTKTFAKDKVNITYITYIESMWDTFGFNADSEHTRDVVQNFKKSLKMIV